MNIELSAQKNEITEQFIYLRLAKKAKDLDNKKILESLAQDELKHYTILKKHTKVDIAPNKFKIWWYSFLATVLGIAFALHLMEKGERFAQELYKQQKHKDFQIMLLDEQKHEKALIKILKDPRVEYAGSIVLGLNDALVELTGALAGLSLALANGKLIAVIGGITGFAASLSMAASAYLSSKEDKNNQNAMKGAIYTGVAYLITVILLILPFIFIRNVFVAMVLMLCITISIIGFYTFYISTAREERFFPRFIEMALISLGVAAISFAVGWLIRMYVGVDV